MNPVRKATPDSEAVGSSEDERPWPASMSFGKFPMKENSVPGLAGGIWAPRKGSFKMSDAAKLNAARETVRLGAVNPTRAQDFRGGNTPSPSAGDSTGSLPFAIPLQPTPKTGRSLSHSTGQREVSQNAGNHGGAASGQGAAAATLPLGLLAEEADTDSESEIGSKLSHTTSHPPIGSLMRTATLPPTFDPAQGNGRGPHHQNHSPQPGLLRGRPLDAAIANLSLERPSPRTHWQSSLGWDDVPNVNESRRHSLADIPTRRGSLAAGEPSSLSRTFTHDPSEVDEHAVSQHYPSFATDRSVDELPNMTIAQDTAAALDIPLMYRVPYVELNPSERREIEARREQQPTTPSSAQWGPGGTRPRKQLYIVSFKCSRVDVFYLLDNTGLAVREGDLVIVEADRGQDLGTVQHAKVTPEAAKLLKKKYSEEQYKWLMMYSRNKEGGFNPNAQFHGDNSMNTNSGFQEASNSMHGAIPRDNFNNLKPKAIKRLASDHEIKMLAEKEGNEAKAKRTCQQKVAHLRLQMEILDAEWQWDFQKLIFYYYADHYINFKDLITELYRIYKTRIWLSAINPASFSQHAMGQPPSGIGPGAVPPYNPYALNSNYTMAYGEDRDPYGAQMPYRIPYDTYTPNYPSIPGVANSFAPQAFAPGQNYMFYGQSGPNQAMAVQRPAGEPSGPDSAVNPSGRMMDYNAFTNQGYPPQPEERVQQAHTQSPSFADPSLPFHQPGQQQFGAWNVNTAGSIAGLGRGAQQAPIGTRPYLLSDRGIPSDQSQQQLMFGRQGAVNDSARPVSNGSGQSLQNVQANHGKQDSSSKAGVMDHYLMNLPSPGDMRAEDTKRDH